MSEPSDDPNDPTTGPSAFAQPTTFADRTDLPGRGNRSQGGHVAQPERGTAGALAPGLPDTPASPGANAFDHVPLSGYAFGPLALAGAPPVFRLWAPSARQVELVVESAVAPQRAPMQREPDGWHTVQLQGTGPGTRYRFSIDGGAPVPDPASRYNPLDVHGPSEVTDPGHYAWQDQAWRGRPWHEAVIYELHIGTFTPEGTFASARQQLQRLVDIGITAIEVMPLADMPGRRNWGYDGVLHYAPDAGYGTPDELKALVDHAHAIGLMVLLDVVYNHFGPDGNYLHGYCPEFFNPRHQTPWGAAINYDGPHNGPVRQFFFENALYWVEEFHFDGLRLDAVHQIRDDSAKPIVLEIAERLRSGPGRLRHVHLVLENELNQATTLVRDEAGMPRWASAQWNDDLHHCAHVLATGETDGYYGDFAAQPAEQLARALAQGFVYQGQPSEHHDGATRGEPSDHLPATAFVSFLQNHDQIGNRALGHRIGALSTPERLDTLYGCLLLSPHIPMFFMGEEFAASTPFLYFCDFEGELAQAISNGRRSEFARFKAFADEGARAQIPDPNADETFAQSKLRWAEADAPGPSPHRDRLTLISTLLAARHRHLVPRLPGIVPGAAYRCEGELLRIEWILGDGKPWLMVANLGQSTVQTDPVPDGITVFVRGVKPLSDGRLSLGPNALLVLLVGATADDLEASV
jgi:maltooligosyltrehalose trehalohydrolase